MLGIDLKHDTLKKTKTNKNLKVLYLILAPVKISLM